MLRTAIAACLLASTLAGSPVMAQTAPGPTRPTLQQPGPAGGGSGPAQTTSPGAEDSQGKVVGTPKDPGSTTAQRGMSLVPLAYVGVVALLGALVFWVAWRRRSRRG